MLEFLFVLMAAGAVLAAASLATAPVPRKKAETFLTDPGQRLDEAERLFREHKRTQAAKLYRSVLRDSPDNVIALTQLGTIASLEGELAEARRHFEQAARKHPSPTTHYNLGLVSFQQKEYAQAVTYFKRAADVAPTHQRLIALSKALAKAGDKAGSDEALERAARHRPHPASEAVAPAPARPAKTAPQAKAEK